MSLDTSLPKVIEMGIWCKALGYFIGIASIDSPRVACEQLYDIESILSKIFYIYLLATECNVGIHERIIPKYN